MQQRILTGLVLIAMVAFCMFISSSIWPMLMMMTVISFIGAKEWLQFIPTVLSPLVSGVFIALTTTICLALLFAPLGLQVVVWGLAGLFWLCALYWVCQYPNTLVWHRTFLLLAVGLLLLSATTSALYSLWVLNKWWLFYVFILVWTADSGAYFVGRKFGKRKLATKVSPGKTIEGFIGGLLLCVLVIIGLSLTVEPYAQASMAKLVAISLLTVLASVLGDLLESMLKRQSGIKDSGTLLPGHGGVLDRIDSLLAAAPVFAFCVFAIGLL